MLNHSTMLRLSLVAVPVILVGSGCLKRKEIIQVRNDGAVRMELDYSGSKDDLQGPDAMPSAKQGWTVEQSIRHEGDQDTHVLKASADFAPGAALPATYGDGSDLYLQFPTEVRREKRADGTYFHFHRRYVPRAFAVTQYWKDRYIDDDIKKLGEKDAQSLTDEERTKLIRAFANVESHQQLEVLQRAVKTALPDLTDESWLAARRSLLDVYDRFDYEGLAKSVKGMNEEQANKKIVDVGDSIPKDAKRAFLATLRKQADLGNGDMERLAQAIDRETLRRKITDSTRSHLFQIELAMPGEIVAHNGDRIENGRIVWEFPGDAFCDRSYDLTAVSRLPSKQ